MDAHLTRAELLIEQGRYEQAEAELRRQLAEEPNDPISHAVLAGCLSEREQFQAATEHAERAVHLAPDIGFVHHALARVLFDRRRFAEAQTAAEEAVRMEPENPAFFALLAQVHLASRNWSEALEAAERGLEIDPEHAACANLRSIALIKLGYKSEAGDTIAGALARDPNNPLSHASRGWGLLEEGKPREAMEHFGEALRLDPNLEWAQAGIVEAMQARNIIYRFMLRYFLWMAKLDRRVQWGVIIGGYVGYRVLVNMADDNPGAAPFIMPLLVVYVAFVLMTWLAGPLFNLVLRLDRFGRLVLSRDQRIGSTLVGWCLLAAIVLLALALATGLDRWWFVALAFGVLSIPVSTIYRCEEGWPRVTMGVYSAVMLACALFGAMPWEWIGQNGELPPGVAGLEGMALIVFLLGAVGAPWVANILANVTPRR